MYPVCLKLMRELITRKEVSVSLAVVDALFETSVQLHDEVTLKVMLDSLLELDESNLRVLKMLVALMIRIGDRPKLEEYFKRLIILQLQSGNLPEARDNLKQMVVYGQSNLCLDLLNRLNEAMVSGSSQDVRETCEKVIRVLEGGTLESPRMSGIGLALGVSEADLGAGLAVESQDDL